MMRRREFLKTAAGSAASAWCGCATRPGPAATGIIDTHVHFYDPARPQGVPWPPAADAFLHRTVLPDELKTLAGPLGVTGVVIVEASAWEEDNQWVLDLADRDPFILGVVGHLKPGRPGFRDHLQRFARNPKFCGIRAGLWNAGVEADEAAWMSDIARLADLGLSLDIGSGVANMEAADRIAGARPDLRLVINHHGGARIREGAPDARWLQAVQSLGRRANVSMKISGLVEGTGLRDGTAPTGIDPYVAWFDAVRDAFGADRLLFGSNWPVSARFASYGAVLDLARQCLARLPVNAMDQGLRLNAIRAYGLAG